VAGAWQFPQGGIDAGETAWEALVRELEEEVGLMPGEYLAGPVSGPHRYDFPNGRLRGEFGGQEQTWFLVELKEDGVGITHETADREFRALTWIVPGDFRLGWLVPMKHEVYRVVMWEFFGVELRE
jgi:putative (di)nucleoside polyphosphate hydrolase